MRIVIKVGSNVLTRDDGKLGLSYYSWGFNNLP